MDATIIVVDRKTMMLKNVLYSSTWFIVEDALSPDTSEFILYESVKDADIKAGDIIICDVDYSEFPFRRTTTIDGNIYQTPFYIGIADSYIDNQLNVRSFLELMNGNIILRATTPQETHPGIYIKNQWDKYFKSIDGMLIDNVDVIFDPTNMPEGWEIVFDIWPPQEVNMQAHLTDIFTKVQVVTECVGFRVIDKKYYFSFLVSCKKDPIFINTDIRSLYKNTEVYIQEANVGIPNALTIVDPDFDLETRYLGKDGTIYSVINDQIETPIRNNTIFYEGGEDPDDLAKDNLEKQDYNHEITIDTVVDESNLFIFDLGRLCDIRYSNKDLEKNKRIYNSIVSGYTINANKKALLNCGNFRSTLKMVLDGSDKED